MKVEEAKKKVCPFMGELSKFGHPAQGFCIAGDCMAWAWIPMSEAGLSKDKEGYCIRLSDNRIFVDGDMKDVVIPKACYT